MEKIEKYQASEKAQIFSDSVSNDKYDRQIITGIKNFMDGKAPENLQFFYSRDELKTISNSTGAKRDLEVRTPVKKLHDTN